MNSKIYDFNNQEMIEAIQMMGFEPLEMDFFRRVEPISNDALDDTSLIIYCELQDNGVEINVYEDAKWLEVISNITSSIEFIDTVERILDTYDIASVKLTPLDSSIRINGKPIIAAENTRDLAKKLIRVKSSNVWAYAFQPNDYNKGTMLMQFKGANGGPDDIYIYYDVPNKLWQKFVAAPSKGHFFWQHIRNVFKYGKLTGDKRTKLKNGI